ncbi:SMI1/KNR4 family protein [Actinomadura sp. 21ATH]|uniref:SMI1/KNR4 family protein n=1 Tax=Actinomadura sp. 21ATH TaxID=1735444 RepID=UPI0035C11F75
MPLDADFLRRFAADWSTPLSPADGCSEEDLSAAEERLGVRLPASVRDFYKLLGRRPDLTSNQDRLLPPAGLHFDESGQALVFRDENQGCAQWGIPVQDLHLPDPPVVFQLDAPYIAPEPWRPFLDRFSLTAAEIVLSENLFRENAYSDNQEPSDATLNALELRYTRLPLLPDYPMWATPEDPPVRWFTAPDVLIRDDSDAWLWVRARTERALDETRRALPGDWQLAPT